MSATVRIYETEERAREAARKLGESGFREDTIALVTASPGGEAAAVAAAVRDERLPGSHATVCIQNLKQGRSIVAVRAPFGRDQAAVSVMDSCGPVGTEQLPSVSTSSPDPFSEFFSIPTLTDGSAPLGELSSFSFSSAFGLGLLSRNPAPLSSLFGLRTISGSKGPWRSSFGMPLLSDNPAPLSSLFSMPLLTKGKGRD